MRPPLTAPQIVKGEIQERPCLNHASIIYPPWREPVQRTAQKTQRTRNREKPIEIIGVQSHTKID